MIALDERTVGGRRAKVWLGGDGAPLLLLHGAWGGAAMHWASVWGPLARRFRVVAPELPGLGDVASPALPSFDAYAEWVAALLAEVDAERALCVGNSLGAAVAWQLSARLGDRCRGLVLVNGPPPREAPAFVRALATLGPPPLLRALYRRLSFSPKVLARAFADPARAPTALARALAAPSTTQLDALVAIVAHGARAAPRPAVPILLAWGAADRLPGTSADDARALGEALPGAQLVLLPSAGHCPQLEQPAAFASAIVAFAEAGPALRAAGR